MPEHGIHVGKCRKTGWVQFRDLLLLFSLAFLERPFATKELIEKGKVGAGLITGAQSLMMMHNLRASNEASKPLSVKHSSCCLRSRHFRIGAACRSSAPRARSGRAW